MRQRVRRTPDKSQKKNWPAKKKTKSTGSKDDKKTKLLKLGQKLSRAISKLEKDEINANACFLGKKRRLAEGREKLGKAEEDQKK